MARSNSTATVRGQACSIPRYIQSLQNIGARAGLKASWKIEKSKDGEFIQTRWRGTWQQFRKTHFLTPKYRFPLARGRVWTSGGLRGEMTKVDDGYELVCNWPKPDKIEHRNSLEILYYSPSNPSNPLMPDYYYDGDKCVSWRHRRLARWRDHHQVRTFLGGGKTIKVIGGPMMDGKPTGSQTEPFYSGQRR